jgi:hypothetical protein
MGVIVMGKVGEQVETLLWREKLKPFLTPGTFKEIRVGNALQRVEALDGSYTILLMSHHNAEEARQKAQGFDYQYVWLDEMPSSISLVSELALRVITSRGRMIVSFTPLIRNGEIKEWAENLDSRIGKIYKAGMLDNPVFKGREEEALLMVKDLPEAERNARLYGQWLLGDMGVYAFDAGRDLCSKPQGYHPQWDHLFAVDPASAGKTGWALFAKRPSDSQWFQIESGYYKEKVPTKNVEKAEQIAAGKKIVRRVADPHESWFIEQAAALGYHYLSPFNKNSRKPELIKQLQDCIYSRVVMFVEGQEELNREFSTCTYSDNTPDKIVNASSYHILDAVQYGIDMIPGLKAVAKERRDAIIAPKLDFKQVHAKEIKDSMTARRKRQAILDKLRKQRFGRGARWRA